jgi:hypothetical protein
MNREELLVLSAIRKAPIRSVMLGSAALALLLIAGVQSNLLVISPKLGVSALSLSAAPETATSKEESKRPSSLLPNEAAGSAPTTLTSSSRPALARARRHKAQPSISVPPPPAAGQIVVPLSNLDVAVQHQFKDATLFVWVDDQLALTRPLHGGVQKKLVVFNGIRGVDSETLRIPAGKHVLRLRALSSDETIDLSKTVSAEFIGGGEKSLQVSFDKHNTVMHLVWQ